MPALIGGAVLSSSNSMALLRTYSFNSGTTNHVGKSLATVLSHRLLTALYAIDPMSYVFAYRSEASNQVYPPSSPSPSTLPPRLSSQPLRIHGFYRLVFSRRVQ